MFQERDNLLSHIMNMLRLLSAPHVQCLEHLETFKMPRLSAISIAAGEGSTAGWEGDTWQPSAEDMEAVDSCLGTLGGDSNMGNWTQGQSALADGAVKLLQAFIDSNG